MTLMYRNIRGRVLYGNQQNDQIAAHLLGHIRLLNLTFIVCKYTDTVKYGSNTRQARIDRIC